MKRIKIPAGLILLALALALASLFACSAAEVTAPTVPPQSPAPPETYPSILGVRADVVSDDGVLTRDVSFGVDTAAYPSAFVNWAGDFIFYLDVTPPSTPGQTAVTAEGTYQATLENYVIWKNLDTGRHTLSVQLVQYDNAPLDPPVGASIVIDVPSPTTTMPIFASTSLQMLCRPGYIPPGGSNRPAGASACADINVIPDIMNFNIVAGKIGKPAAAGEGHFIYYFNVAPPTEPGKPALTAEGTCVVTGDAITSWLGVLPGEYDVWVQLVNNDNTPLQPPVVSGGSIIVPIDAERY
jgi:hypothetical protein